MLREIAGEQKTIFQVLLLVVFVMVLSGCGGPYIYNSLQHRSITLESGDLQRGGIAFITPSSITGREEDRQSLALTFANTLMTDYPDIRIVGLPETLSAINQANLTSEYKTMFNEYKDTGIFNQETLRKIGEITGVRYLAQLKLAGFQQESSGRWGVLGLRIIETKRANIRVFMQIWDSQQGRIAWEGLEELNYSKDTPSEEIVTFSVIAKETARSLLAHIPYQHQPELVPLDQAKAEASEILDF